MTTPAGPPASTLMPGTDGPVWHALSADRVLQAEAVDGQRGLSSVEVVSRTERFGPNTFDTAKVESRWRAFVRQYTDPMQVVLLVAGIVSLFLKEFETGVVLILLTLFNAVLGLRQEGKAAAAVAVLLLFQAIGLGYGKAAEGLMDRKPRQPNRPILSRGLLIWLATTGLVMGIGTLGVLSWAEQERTLVIAHTMGVVTFSLYALFFSVVTKDERRTTAEAIPAGRFLPSPEAAAS